MTGRRRWLLGGLAIVVGAVAVLVWVVGAAMYGNDPWEVLLTRDDDGCPHQLGPRLVSVDWAGDFLQVDGRRYWRLEGGDARPDQVAEEITTIRCTVGADITSTRHLRDDHALFLPVGTTLHRFGDDDPAFRLVTGDEGDLAIYEVEFVPDATTGASLLPLQPGEVLQITMEADGRSSVDDDPATIARVLDALQRAPLDPDWPGPGVDTTAVIRFDLRDQPPKVLDVWVDAGRTFEGLHIPPEVLGRLP